MMAKRRSENVIAQRFYVCITAGRNLSWTTTSHMTNVTLVLLSDVDAASLLSIQITSILAVFLPIL